MDIISAIGGGAAAAPSATASPAAAPSAPGSIAAVASDINEAFDLGLVNTIIYAAIVAGIVLVILKLLNKFLKPRFAGNSLIFYRLINVVIVVVAAMAVLLTIKPLRELGIAVLASSGIVALVVGLAAQSTMANLFSGLSISMSKPFSVGEFVEIVGSSPPVIGVVQEIGLRHTTIRDPESKLLVVPNSILDKSMVRTTHFTEGVNVCSFLFVNISYGSDVEKALALLAEIVDAHEDALDVRTEEQIADEPKVSVLVTALSDYYVQLRAAIWTVDTATGFKTLSDLRRRTLKVFAENGIEIPYPYMNVIQKNAAGREN